MNYLPIPYECLQLNTTPDFRLYLKYGDKYVLYKDSGINFSIEDKERLSRNHSKLYIENNQTDEYKKYVDERISSILIDRNVPSKIKGNLLYQVSSSYIEEVFKTNVNQELDGRYRYLVEQIVGLWLSDPETLTSVTLLNNHSEYEYSHAVQVSAMSIMLATLCFNLNRFELIDIGVAGLLHDIGKIYVPKAVLSKPGKLDKEEFEALKKHPTDGSFYLSKITKFNPTILSAIEGHHECIDGSGYPKGLREHQIGRNARLVAIADTFCALISNRSYRPAYTHADACTLLKKEFYSKLDVRMVNKLSEHILGLKV
jgi:HD-GYP domain-containing protein (c-di-GMP phosphodiesterase class II)